MVSFFDKSSHPRLFAHRGDSLNFPENTLPAFDAAVNMGIPYLETDVHSTLDGVVVISHDPTTDKMTGSIGSISKMTYEDLMKLDAGYSFTSDGGNSFPFRGKGVTYTTLEDMLKTFPQTCVNLDIKAPTKDIEYHVRDAIISAGAEGRVCVAAFQDAVINRFRNLGTHIATSFAAQETFDFISRYDKGELEEYTPEGKALQILPKFGGRDVVTPEILSAAHECGIEIHVWTINEPEEMRELMARPVDGIMTDDPSVLLKIHSEIF